MTRIVKKRVFILAGVFVLLVGVYTFIYSYISIHYWNNFLDGAFDLGLYDQAFWLISTCHLEAYSTFRFVPFAMDHFSLIIYPFSILYLIWPSAIFLLIIQSLLLGSGMVPLYFLTRNNIDSRILSLVLSICYLLYPPLGGANLDAFHPEVLAVPALLWMFWADEGEHYILFYTMLFLTLITKELASIVITAYGIGLVFKKRYRKGVLLIFIGVLWFAIAYSIINVISSKMGGVDFNDLARYSYMGNSFGEIILYLITHPMHSIEVLINGKLYVWQILAPTVFLSLFSPAELIPAGVVIWINLLSNNYLTHLIYLHHTLFIIPFIWYGTIKGLKWIIKLFNRIDKNVTKNVVAVLFFACSLGMFFKWMLPAILYRISLNNILTPQLVEASSLIPGDASLIGTGYIVAHLSHRQYVYDIDTLVSFKTLNTQGINKMLDQIPRDRALYIFLVPEMAKKFNQEAKIAEDKLLNMLLNNHTNIIYNQNGVFVFKIEHGSDFVNMLNLRLQNDR
jgi:uncharacterized membrane protein